MKTLIRPLILIVLVSFFLGVYYQLIGVENHRPLLQELQNSPLIILTRHPEVWQDLTRNLASGQDRVEVETVNAPLAEYPDALKHCDLVEVRSDTAPAMIQYLKLGAPLPGELKSRLSLVHADFFAGPFRERTTPVIPLLWGAYQWFVRIPKAGSPLPKWDSAWHSSSPTRPVYVEADPDALLAQMLESDLSPPMEIEMDESALEPENTTQKPALQTQQWFDSWKSKVLWAFGMSAKESKDRAKMESIELAYLRVEDAAYWPQLSPTTPPQMVIWGLAPCHKPEVHPDTLRLIDEIGRGEHQIQALKRWNLSSTLNASSHWPESATKWTARGIRQLHFSSLTWRSLSWEALLVWDRMSRPKGGRGDL